MANLLTFVAATLQLPSTCLDANMLCFNRRNLSRELVLSSGCLSLSSFLLSWAAMFAALMTTTAQVGLTNSHAHGILNGALVADTSSACSATSARNIYSFIAKATIAGMTP
jgi:hypothetical protein